MDLFLFIFLIVLVGCGSGVANEWLKRRPPRERADPGLAKEVDALKSRVETLERIVTDRRYGLEMELDALDEGSQRAAG